MTTKYLFTAGLALALALPAGAAPRKTASSARRPSMIQIPPASGEERRGPAGLITTDLSGRDVQFLRSMIESGMLQAFLGELAQTKATSEQLKTLAGTLYATQREENRQLMRIVSLKGLAASPVAPPRQQKLAAELEPLSGPKFDKVWLEQLLAVNEEAVGAFQGAAESRDGDIKALAAEMQPIAKQKLLIVNKMAGNSAPAPPPPSFRTGAPIIPE